MAFQRTASICFCIVITSAIAYGQRQGDIVGRPYSPSTTMVQPTYGPGNYLPRTVTRVEDGGRRVVENLIAPDIEGRLRSLEEVVTETTQRPGATSTVQDLFWIDINNQRRFAESIESRVDTQANGDTTAVRNSWVRDVNGRLRLRTQLVEEARSYGPGMQQVETTLLLPGINAPTREARRTEYTTQQISPELSRNESTSSVRDVNGRWKPVEMRRGEVRRVGAERIEEETVRLPDMNGKLSIAETNVMRSSSTPGQEQMVIETYSSLHDIRAVNGRPPLTQRITRTTTATPDGGRYTVEDLESVSRATPSAPLRVVRRIVTTVVPGGPGEWITQREVYEVDANNRLVLLRVE